MKALVDSGAGAIRGTYDAPLDFSISGHYVIDIPDIVNARALNSSPNSLINSKVTIYKNLHPTLTVGSFHDEILNTTLIDPVHSNGVIIGPLKRTVIFPGGTLMTTQLIPPGSVAKVFLHYYGFILGRNVGQPTEPAASEMLYNWDVSTATFTDFNTTDLTASVYDGGGTLQFTPTPDTEYTASAPNPFRLGFVNTTSHPIYLSDWIILLG